jgi:hypothetical protein
LDTASNVQCPDDSAAEHARRKNMGVDADHRLIFIVQPHTQVSINLIVLKERFSYPTSPIYFQLW